MNLKLIFIKLSNFIDIKTKYKSVLPNILKLIFIIQRSANRKLIINYKFIKKELG